MQVRSLRLESGRASSVCQESPSHRVISVRSRPSTVSSTVRSEGGVLMYQPNPVEAIRRLANALRPGELVVFQEHDSSMVPALTPLPLHDRVHEWIWRTIEREGANVHMGFHLASVLEQAGLTVEHVRAEAIVQTPKAHYAVEPIVRAMLPRIVQQGVACEEEVNVDTLDERLIEERQKANATYVGDMVFGA